MAVTDPIGGATELKYTSAAEASTSDCLLERWLTNHLGITIHLHNMNRDAAAAPALQHLAEVDGQSALDWRHVYPCATTLAGLQSRNAILREQREESTGAMSTTGMESIVNTSRLVQ
jgi:hypothetical protein